MEEFLDSISIPKYIQNHLGIAGMNSIEDLTELTDEFIQEIEEMVRDGKFSNEIDLTSRQNRIKYLGSDYSNLEAFSFRPFDRIKLRRVSDQAKAKLLALKERPRPSSPEICYILCRNYI